jgi:hypothetical protein
MLYNDTADNMTDDGLKEDRERFEGGRHGVDGEGAQG